jgi:hypothetical protein
MIGALFARLPGATKSPALLEPMAARRQSPGSRAPFRYVSNRTFWERRQSTVKTALPAT